MPSHHLTVPDTLAGERLDVVIARLAPQISRRQARRLVDDGSVSVDGKRIQVCSRPMRPGARLEIHVAETERAPAQTPKILFQDTQLIVVDKASGVPTEPTREGSRGTLKAAIEEHLKKAGEDTRFLHAVHRLDTDTTGVVVFARSSEAAHIVGRQLHDAKALRRYLAVVKPPPAWLRARLDAPLSQERDAQGRIQVDAAGAPSVTLAVTLARGEKGALLLVAPETGRTHQIRVHLANAGHGLVGDRRYGKDTVGSHLGLHALSLAIVHPDGQPLVLFAPPPAAFVEAAALVGIEDSVVDGIVSHLATHPATDLGPSAP